MAKDLSKTVYDGIKSLVSRKLAVTGGASYMLYEGGHHEHATYVCMAYVLGMALIEAAHGFKK